VASLIDEIPYDLLTANAEQNILNVLSSSGLAITTISLIIDKIKVNLDAQKHEIISQLRLKETKKIIEEQTIKK
jgi:hypothetical protein